MGNSVYATLDGGGSGQGTKFASFDLVTGSVGWQVEQNLLFPSYPTYAQGLLVYTAMDPERLYVRDAASGSLRYSVALPQSGRSSAPTVYRNPATGDLTAYLCDQDKISAVRLGATSGSVLWTQTGNAYGGLSYFSMPTVVGQSAVLAGPGQYYAFDLTTGTRNHFHSGDLMGGGGATVVCDEQRREMYILEAYDSQHYDALTAYHYEGNGNIMQLWQKTGPGIQEGCAVALGTDGAVYAAAGTTLLKLDPDDGATLQQRSLTTSLARGCGVMLSDDALWTFTGTQTRAFSLDNLDLLGGLPASRGDMNTPYRSPGAIVDGYVLLNGVDGFSVYAPEPASLVLFAFGLWGIGRRR